SATAHLRRELAAALQHGRAELEKNRSGSRDAPVLVALAAADGHVLAVLPVDAGFRADPEASPDRAQLLTAATVATLFDLAEADGAPDAAAPLGVQAGELDGDLVIALPSAPLDAADLEELVPLAFEERAATIDRLKAQAIALPPAVLADATASLRPPIGDGHPLRVAEAVARLGGQPADPRSVDEHEESVLALLGPGAGADAAARPHEDPDPARRVARRILQRLNGMGKWGGYHTDFAHLARGFAGNERALAQEVGEALLSSGLLAEKPSVGQRHVFLNPRRASDIHALIDRGTAPRDLRLPFDTRS
ncbi:MAG TPA: hypothetical protein VF533_15700, partial [Solirubrobacteraceae bacterium]